MTSHKRHGVFNRRCIDYSFNNLLKLTTAEWKNCNCKTRCISKTSAEICQCYFRMLHSCGETWNFKGPHHCPLVTVIHQWPVEYHHKWPATWWRHQMETFSGLLALCAGNSPVSGEFPTQRPVTRSFDVFFDLRLIKRLSKHSRCWWFETLSLPLWWYEYAKRFHGMVSSCNMAVAVLNQ